MIAVEVACDDRLVSLLILPGSTVHQAIAAAGIGDLPADLADNVGIFARACSLQQVLQAGDRVEIYRPLRVDPKAQRRARAETAKSAGKNRISGNL